MSFFLFLGGVVLIMHALTISSHPSSEALVPGLSPETPSSALTLNTSSFSLEKGGNPTWLSTTSWPEGSLLIEKFGSDFHYGGGVIKISADFRDLGRQCIYRGQRIAFNHVIDSWLRNWPRDPPTDLNAFPQSEHGLDDVLQAHFQMSPAVWRHHGSQTWRLAEEVVVWLRHEYSTRGCVSSKVMIWIWFRDGIYRLFGTFSLDVKEPPAFDPHSIWRLSPDYDWIFPIEGENRQISHLTFLDRNQARATWPDPAARNLLDLWTDPDPVRRPFVVWLLHRAVAQIKRRPVQDAHGTIDLAKYLQNSPIMNFWVEVAQPTQRSQAAWTKQLAIHVFTTLAHLISRHGIISCIVDVVQEGRFVGQVWLGANIEDGQ